MAIETKKTKVKMNKLIYLGMSILDISKTGESAQILIVRKTKVDVSFQVQDTQ